MAMQTIIMSTAATTVQPPGKSPAAFRKKNSIKEDEVGCSQPQHYKHLEPALIIGAHRLAAARMGAPACSAAEH